MTRLLKPVSVGLATGIALWLLLAIAGFAQTTNAPETISIPGLTPTTNAPGSRVVSGLSPTTNSPGTVTLSGSSPTTNAPAAITVPGGTPTTNAPTSTDLAAVPLENWPAVPIGYYPVVAVAGGQPLTINFGTNYIAIRK